MSKHTYHFFGSILRDLRHDRHMVAADAARRAGVSEGQWMKWEREIEMPTEIWELHGISDALDMPVGDIWACLFMDLKSYER